MDDKYMLVCAIDLGTTYSGYAYAFKDNKINILMNNNWGEAQGFQSHKTPTYVLTGPNNQFLAFGYDALKEYIEYQNRDENGYDLFQHFKMILHKTTNWNETVTVASTAGNNRPAIEIFTFMIEALKNHFFGAIKPTVLNPENLKEDEILWVLTVPAIWSDTAKDFMREVALRAGLIKERDSEQLLIALEPEAAALFCTQKKVRIFGNTKESSLRLNKDEKYIIIDAGGGTIDITAHQVVNGLKLKEITTANGGDWGGIAVDMEFKKLLVKIFGVKFVSEYEKKIFGILCCVLKS
jgi:molecular chaperone DnaK (HSP70)